MSRSPDAPTVGGRLSALAQAALRLLGAVPASVVAIAGGRRAQALGRPDGMHATGGRGDGPPDLDELWRDFNRKLNGLFGGKGGGRPNGPGDGGGGRSFPPDMRNAGIGVSLIAGVVVVIWLASGFFIVQEGWQAVVTTFGRYSQTVDAGFRWRMPYPFQSSETVWVTQLRSVEVGRNIVVQATGLRDSSMLTQDENIVDIRFTVQYRLSDARNFLFTNKQPEEAVVQAGESAVREVGGKSTMDSVLYEQRDAIATELVKSTQAQLNRLGAGIQIVNVNVQNVQAPEQVQQAFDDAFKATADRERFKNDGQAYANDILPKAQGTSARLREEAEGYKARVVAQAEGDAERFSRVLAEYQKAPTVTRDRMYIDTMQQIYSNVSKVMVDSRNNSNLLYLPLDKLLQSGGSSVTVTPAPAVPAADAPVPPAAAVDIRSRDNQRTREREGR